jgi:hypothetical protein
MSKQKALKAPNSKTKKQNEIKEISFKFYKHDKIRRRGVGGLRLAKFLLRNEAANLVIRRDQESSPQLIAAALIISFVLFDVLSHGVCQLQSRVIDVFRQQQVSLREQIFPRYFRNLSFIGKEPTKPNKMAISFVLHLLLHLIKTLAKFVHSLPPFKKKNRMFGSQREQYLKNHFVLHHTAFNVSSQRALEIYTMGTIPAINCQD